MILSVYLLTYERRERNSESSLKINKLNEVNLIVPFLGIWGTVKVQSNQKNIKS